MFQITKTDSFSYYGQRFHEEFGATTDFGNCGLYVSYGVCQGVANHQGRRHRQHRVRDGGGQGGGVQGGQVPVSDGCWEVVRRVGHPLQLSENSDNQGCH